MTVFNCGVLLILENEVNGINNNKTTFSLTSYNALVSRQLKNQFLNFSWCSRGSNTSRNETNQAAAIHPTLVRNSSFELDRPLTFADIFVSACFEKVLLGQSE